MSAYRVPHTKILFNYDLTVYHAYQRAKRKAPATPEFRAPDMSMYAGGVRYDAHPVSPGELSTPSNREWQCGKCMGGNFPEHSPRCVKRSAR